MTRSFAAKGALLGAALLALAGCAGPALQELTNRAGLTSPPSQFTATRASLAQAGITAPLIRVTLRAPRLETVGLLESPELGTVPRGADLYLDGAGSGFFLDGGLLRASTGQARELVGAETAPIRTALAQGGGRYARAMRHRGGEGRVFETTLFCTLEATGRETLAILGRSHAVRGYVEACTGSGAGSGTGSGAGAGTGAGGDPGFENRYWIDADSGPGAPLRASEQWLNSERGTIRIEQVQ